MDFNSLPGAIAKLQIEVEVIKRLIEQLPSQSQPDQDEILTIDEAASFLHLKRPTLYTMVSERRVPFMK